MNSPTSSTNPILNENNFEIKSSNVCSSSFLPSANNQKVEDHGTNNDNNCHSFSHEIQLDDNQPCIEVPSGSKSNNKSQLSFGHANMRGLLSKLDVLMGYIVSKNFLIFSVVETNLRDGVNPEHSAIINENPTPDNFPLYDFVGKSRFKTTGIDQARGGTGVFIHRSLHFTDISAQAPKGLECTLITFDYKKLSFVFASVYLPQKSDNEIVLMSKLLDIICEMGCDCILLAGDFNAHHPAWGDSTNKRGVDLYDAITSHGW